MDGQLFVNVRSGNLVQVVNDGGAVVTISTVQEDGLGRKRRISSDAFHDNYFGPDGEPRKTGYAPVNTLPGDHPHAMKTEIDDMDMADHFDSMTDEELAEVIERQQQAKERAVYLVDKAKAVIKSRAVESGTRVYGDNAVILSSARKFDAATARKNLTSVDFQRILLPKPDATLAARVFENEPEKLVKCQKDNGWTLTVRKATDKDHENAALTEAVTRSSGEEFYLQ